MDYLTWVEWVGLYTVCGLSVVEIMFILDRRDGIRSICGASDILLVILCCAAWPLAVIGLLHDNAADIANFKIGGSR